jgi:hypothetical protein
MGIKPKSYATHPHRTEEHGMEFRGYYVVEVSFRPSNPVHRYIAHSARGECVDLAGGGLAPEERRVRLDQLAFFQVVEEIRSMQEKPSRDMPPAYDTAAVAAST